MHAEEKRSTTDLHKAQVAAREERREVGCCLPGDM